MRFDTLATRHDRTTGEPDHTEAIAIETDRDEARQQATLDARANEGDERITLDWTPAADGGETARTQHNAYRIQPA